jgi:hypothetical protein
MRGAQNLYHFGVLEYVVMIEILWQRRRLKSFYDAIIVSSVL